MNFCLRVYIIIRRGPGRLDPCRFHSHVLFITVGRHTRPRVRVPTPPPPPPLPVVSNLRRRRGPLGIRHGSYDERNSLSYLWPSSGKGIHNSGTPFPRETNWRGSWLSSARACANNNMLYCFNPKVSSRIHRTPETVNYNIPRSTGTRAIYCAHSYRINLLSASPTYIWVCTILYRICRRNIVIQYAYIVLNTPNSHPPRFPS